MEASSFVFQPLYQKREGKAANLLPREQGSIDTLVSVMKVAFLGTRDLFVILIRKRWTFGCPLSGARMSGFSTWWQNRDVHAAFTSVRDTQPG